MSTIAFGSCNRQLRPQSHWEVIRSFNPSYFFWTGDAIYAKGNKIENLNSAYNKLLDDPHYLEFINNLSVDGIWDDHDYGINDGGRLVPDRDLRKKEFLRFLANKQDTFDHLIEQDGLYHSIDIVADGEVQLKVIFLDTRSWRDPHWIRSVGEYPIKGSALVASALRAAYSSFGFGKSYNGHILGDKQWRWLEEVLKTSKADSHIIVSSIQILTSNPVVESWGHFPVEKRRLFDLLQKIDPKGLVMLSGDVHMGEISKAQYTRSDGNTGEWVEVTSSGLTHSCADGPFHGIMCPLMNYLYSPRRHSSKSSTTTTTLTNNESNNDKQQQRDEEYAPIQYLGANFGLITTTPVFTALENIQDMTCNSNDHDNNCTLPNYNSSKGHIRQYNVNISVQSLLRDPYTYEVAPETHSVLSYSFTINKQTQQQQELQLSATPSRIISVKYPEFSKLPAYIPRIFYAVMVIIMYIFKFRSILRKTQQSRKRKTI